MRDVKHFDKLLRIGRKLAALRKAEGMTQADLAKKANINRVTLSEIENGSPTSIITLIDILSAMNKMSVLNPLLQPQESIYDSIFGENTVEIVDSVEKLKGNRLKKRINVKLPNNLMNGDGR